MELRNRRLKLVHYSTLTGASERAPTGARICAEGSKRLREGHAHGCERRRERAPTGRNAHECERRRERAPTGRNAHGVRGPAPKGASASERGAPKGRSATTGRSGTTGAAPLRYRHHGSDRHLIQRHRASATQRPHRRGRALAHGEPAPPKMERLHGSERPRVGAASRIGVPWSARGSERHHGRSATHGSERAPTGPSHTRSGRSSQLRNLRPRLPTSAQTKSRPPWVRPNSVLSIRIQIMYRHRQPLPSEDTRIPCHYCRRASPF